MCVCVCVALLRKVLVADIPLKCTQAERWGRTGTASGETPREGQASRQRPCGRPTPPISTEEALPCCAFSSGDVRQGSFKEPLEEVSTYRALPCQQQRLHLATGWPSRPSSRRWACPACRAGRCGIPLCFTYVTKAPLGIQPPPPRHTSSGIPTLRTHAPRPPQAHRAIFTTAFASALATGSRTERRARNPMRDSGTSSSHPLDEILQRAFSQVSAESFIVCTPPRSPRCLHTLLRASAPPPLCCAQSWIEDSGGHQSKPFYSIRTMPPPSPPPPIPASLGRR